MHRSRLVKPLALALTLALGGVACAGSDAPGSASGGSGGRTGPRLTGTLNGSGATFPKAFYEEVIAAYSEVQPDVTVNYAGGGSGTGRQNLQDGVVDFAGSDGLVKAEDVTKYKGEFLYVPTVAAPITVSYNLSAVKDLVLDADTTARIFQRQIKRWDDPAIRALNPAAKLPDREITVAHRSDGSGTTENFTKYLAAAAPGTWTLKSGSTVEWPADTQAGNGNHGVAQIVKDTVGAIGYVDFSDARASGLRLATLVNKAGRPVKPTLEATSVALAGAAVADDLTYNPLNADGEGAYPISAPTWILVYRTQSDQTKVELLKSFLTFMLTEGQDFAGEIDYARLPASLQQKALAQVARIGLPA